MNVKVEIGSHWRHSEDPNRVFRVVACAEGYVMGRHKGAAMVCMTIETLLSLYMLMPRVRK